MKNNKFTPLKVGFDFDGVIAYNPLRVIRPLMSFLKLKKMVKRDQLVFFQPSNAFEEFAWWAVHQSSFMPANGFDILKQLIKAGLIEAHLLTGRTTSLTKDLKLKLRMFGLGDLFKTVNITARNEQPHLFKSRLLKEYDLDMFVEDNFDIVQFLKKHNPETKICWITNSLDKHIEYDQKFDSFKDFLIKLQTDLLVKETKGSV